MVTSPMSGLWLLVVGMMASGAEGVVGGGAAEVGGDLAGLLDTPASACPGPVSSRMSGG